VTILSELKRRNVIRMAGLYLVGAWLLTQVASTILPLFDAPSWIARTVVVLLAIGFTPALVFAWIFELTPSGLKRDVDVTPQESIAPETAQRMNRLIIAVLILAVLYFGVDKFVLAPSREAEGSARASKADASTQSIAVLPFVNMSSDKEQDYFSDGLSEELLNQLAQIPQLRVIARTSSFSFKGKEADVATIARALDVANVLEGSVRKSGTTLRITAQLIRASDSSHLWSETYDRALTDVFKVQDEISTEVVAALKLKLLPDQRIANTQRTRNVEAYEQFLIGEMAYRSSDSKGVPNALLAFQRAVELDPSYVNAWVGLALAQGYSADYAPDMEARAARLAEMRKTLAHAIEVDPEFGPAYAMRASVRRSQLDWAGADADARRAARLAGSHLVMMSIYTATSLMFDYRSELDNPDTAIADAREATRVDPLASQAWVMHGFRLWIFGHPDEARPSLQHALSLQSDERWALFTLGAIELRAGNIDDAAAYFQRAPDAFRFTGMAMVAHARGDSRESMRLLDELQTLYSVGFAYQIAQVHAWRGEETKAFDWLGKAFQQRDFGIMRMRFDPFFENLRGDPRFIAMIRQLKLPE